MTMECNGQNIWVNERLGKNVCDAHINLTLLNRVVRFVYLIAIY